MVLQQASDKAAREHGDKQPSRLQPSQRRVPTSSHIAATQQATEQILQIPSCTSPSSGSESKESKSVRKQPRPDDGKVQAVLGVISEESGVALEELTDDSNFADMGIDSLSSMVIGSRLREDLGLELSAEFSLFINCPTVKSLKTFLSDQSPTDAEDIGDSEEPQTAKSPSSPSPNLPLPRQSSPPETWVEVGNADIDSLGSGDDAFNTALQAVSEESGVALDELTDETVFADIGIDSLSSMVITSRFREDLGMSLDSSFNLFEEVPTVERLRQFFGGISRSTTGSSTSSKEDESGSSISSAPEDDEAEANASQKRVHECRPTTSVILQGLPRMAKQILFMLPDGGGSASSYITIPRLHSDVAIVGLNCPYARDPENMNCTHQAMIQSFCNEIKRRQPRGPYHVGGWSSGGAFAYVTAEALVNMGEEVHSIIIVDAPVPQVMEKLPTSFYEYCNNIGLFANQPGGTPDGTAQPPAYLIPHFQATVDVMLDYKVAPLNTTRMPKVGIIWAAETVMEEGNAPRMKGMHFMVQKRKDFGPDGWDTVCPGAEFDIIRAEGANHFTLMVSFSTTLHVLLLMHYLDEGTCLFGKRAN